MRALRRLLLAPVALALAATTACSTGPTGGSDDSAPAAAAAEPGAFPVSIKNHFDTTVIKSQPRRVVTIGWAEHDFAAALGVVPVGASKVTWGGNDHGSTPWFDARVEQLGGPAPVRFDDSSGIPLDEIAELRPDVILVTSWTLTRSVYDKLSELAPVVAFPKAAFTTSWQTSLRLVGEALGLPGRAARVERRTEAAIAAARERYPQLAGTSVAYLSIQPTDMSQIGYLTPNDPRSKVLVELGMNTAPAIRSLSRGSDQYYKMISSDRAGSLESDVAILQNLTRGDVERLVDNPLVGQVPAIRTGHYYTAPDDQTALALGGPSPLSLPWAMKHFVPGLAKVAARAHPTS